MASEEGDKAIYSQGIPSKVEYGSKLQQKRQSHAGVTSV